LERELRVLIVSPYAAARAGLSALAGQEPSANIHVAGFVSGSADLPDALPSARSDVALADPASGEASSLVDSLARHGVGLALLSDDPGHWRVLAEAGLPGWALLPRDAEAAEIRATLRAVGEGLVVLGRAGALPPVSAATPRLPGVGEESGEALTPREREVLQLLADGLPNKVIANRLSVSLHTIKFHVASILAKLGASSRTEAVAVGARRGLVTL
jgi:DNA-binding NarL/FixJ family response regulator